MDIDGVLRAMTLEEKARLLSGVSHWKTAPLSERNIPSIFLSDGPHGLRKQEGKEDHLGIAESVPSTCFPTASALTCSFDPELAYEVGRAIGEEAVAQGVQVVLGPGVNIKRHPLCGRNFEYFSEDPWLSGKMGAAMVRGIQSCGVAACIKHLAANNQEHARMVSDSVVDDRALHEVYLAPFEHVVREAHPWSVMTAYNRLNGVYCSENAWLLQDMLRDTWGFDGAVVSDWGAMDDPVASVAAGLDLCMPGPREDMTEALVAAVRSGELRECNLAAAARRVLELVERNANGASSKSPATDAPAVPSGPAPAASTSPAPVAPAAEDPAQSHMYREHLALARKAAAKSAVLLENDGILPLNGTEKMAVIGAFAREPRYQGSGSSRINPVELDDAWEALCLAGVDAVYAAGYEAETGNTNEVLLDEAVHVARNADVALVFAGLPARYESEGFDRKLMVMPRGMCELIKRVCAANPRTVVVLQGGAPMEMPWRYLPAAVLLMYLSGCQGGAATADVLLGRVNPQGKLAESWPAALEDTALGADYPDMDRCVEYREGLYVGYRYYDAAGVEPAYPFGYGLSYTRFAYGDARVDPVAGGLAASCIVENVGGCAGCETVQLYVAARDSAVYREPQRLAGICKVELEPGQRATVTVELGAEAFRYWDVDAHAWRIDAGKYEVRMGSSSRDIRLNAVVELHAGEVFPVKQWSSAPGDSGAAVPLSAVAPRLQPRSAARVLEAYRNPTPHGFTDEAFLALYGGRMPEDPGMAHYTVNSTLRDMTSTWLGRRVIGLLSWLLAGQAELMSKDQKAMMIEMAAEMPLRSLTSSGVPMKAIEAFVHMLNGRYVTGLIGTVHQLRCWLDEQRKR